MKPQSVGKFDLKEAGIFAAPFELARRSESFEDRTKLDNGTGVNMRYYDPPIVFLDKDAE